MEMIKEEEEEIGQEESRLREQNKEDNKMGNICDPYHELQKSLGQEILRGGWCHDLAKQLSHYLYIFYFLIWTYYTREKCRKVLHDICHISQVTCQDVTVLCHMMESHDECGRVVHRPCSSCISSVQFNGNSIKFSLSTWTWSMIKLSQAKLLHLQ